MQKTEHFNLKKPSHNDFINIDDLNQNTDKIDAILFDKLSKTETAANSEKLGNQPASFYATKDDLSPLSQGLEGKLDKTGGEVTGSINLRGGIVFTPNADIRSSNAEIRLKATGRVIVTNDLEIGGRIVTHGLHKKKTATIGTSGWSTVSGEYPQRYQLNITGLESTDYVSIDIQRSSLKAAEDAELCPTVEEQNGYVYIYAKKVPTSSIAITYKVEV